VNVRRAAPDDLHAIAALLGELGYPVAPDVLHARFARLPGSTIVFVTDDVAGLAALDVRQGRRYGKDLR
jgi:hypothetical protein